MQFSSLVLMALPLMAFASPHPVEERAAELETRQGGFNLTALTECVNDFKTQSCGEAIGSCISSAMGN